MTTTTIATIRINLNIYKYGIDNNVIFSRFVVFCCLLSSAYCRRYCCRCFKDLLTFAFTTPKSCSLIRKRRWSCLWNQFWKQRHTIANKHDKTSFEIEKVNSTMTVTNVLLDCCFEFLFFVFSWCGTKLFTWLLSLSAFHCNCHGLWNLKQKESIFVSKVNIYDILIFQKISLTYCFKVMRIHSNFEKAVLAYRNLWLDWPIYLSLKKTLKNICKSEWHLK